MLDRRRLSVLVALFALVAVTAAYVLQSVFATVFFAVTVAYVLYPVRRFLGRQRFGPRTAAAVSTALAFVAVLVLAVPLAGAFYLRRDVLFAYLDQVPDVVTVVVGPFSYTLDLATAFAGIEDAATGLALAGVRSLPGFAFKAFLFTLVVYALLVRPDRLGEAARRSVPDRYHDVVYAFHRRTRATLYGIYVLQAAVAVATFAVALVVFFALGYESWFTLSVLSGILQFIPIIGPSLLVLGIGAAEVLTGDPQQAVVVVVVGLVVVGFLPDALIRPRLANLTTDMPASLYFIGFTGGTLSIGVVGVVAGPVVVSWLSEAVALLSAETNGAGRPSTVDEWAHRDPDADATPADAEPEPDPCPESTPAAEADDEPDAGADTREG